MVLTPSFFGIRGHFATKSGFLWGDETLMGEFYLIFYKYKSWG